MSVNEKMTAIADAIRETTGRTGKIGLADMAEGVYEAFHSGADAEWNAFWDSAQANGTRTYLTYAFAGQVWSEATFRPKYDLLPAGNINGMFRACKIKNIKQCLKDAGVTMDLSQATKANDAFAYCSSLTTLPKLDLSSVTEMNTAFNNDYVLETIEEIKFGVSTRFINTFDNCTALTNMTVTGVIGQNGLNLSYSPNLTHESLMSVIHALQNKTSGTWTVTLGAENLAKLTNAEKAIATEKGWTLV